MEGGIGAVITPNGGTINHFLLAESESLSADLEWWEKTNFQKALKIAKYVGFRLHFSKHLHSIRDR